MFKALHTQKVYFSTNIRYDTSYKLNIFDLKKLNQLKIKYFRAAFGHSQNNGYIIVRQVVEKNAILGLDINLKEQKHSLLARYNVYRLKALPSNFPTMANLLNLLNLTK